MSPSMSQLTVILRRALWGLLYRWRNKLKGLELPYKACIAPELAFSPPRCRRWWSLGYSGWVSEPRPSGHFHNPASQTGWLEEKKQNVWESLRKTLIHVHELSSVDIHRESESRSVVSNSLPLHGLYSTWNSPGQNTGVGSLSLLQGIFPVQGSNPSVLHWRMILYQLSHKGSPDIPRNQPKIKNTIPSTWPQVLPSVAQCSPFCTIFVGEGWCPRPQAPQAHMCTPSLSRALSLTHSFQQQGLSKGRALAAFQTSPWQGEKEPLGHHPVPNQRVAAGGRLLGAQPSYCNPVSIAFSALELSLPFKGRMIHFITNKIPTSQQVSSLEERH